MASDLPSTESFSTETLPADTLSMGRRKLQPYLLGMGLIGCVVAAWSISQTLAQRRANSAAENQKAQFAQGSATFDLKQISIPAEKILSGGPPKDGIPSLDQPKFMDASQAAYMQAGDKVIGISEGGTAKAYPLKILDSHEIVNDRVNDQPIAVTYCPLCDSSAVFDRIVEGREREFGVSGKLYRSNVLMFDRGEAANESLWSQLMAEGVSNSGLGQQLRRLPLEVTTWESWLARHPQTLVLSNQTGFNRRYDRSYYGRYFSSPDWMFPVGHSDGRLPGKTAVLAVVSGNQAKAFPISTVLDANTKAWEERLAGKSFQVVPDAAGKSLRIEDASEGLEWVYTFWLPWSAVHPDAEIWQPAEDSGAAG